VSTPAEGVEITTPQLCNHGCDVTTVAKLRQLHGVYGFTRDRRNGPSQCYGDCAAAWPVYYAKGTLKAGEGVKQSLLGTTRRRDGRRQVTYNGWPLYYYAHEKAGEVKCQNVQTHGGTWLVLRPAGTLLR
jgi:predicted lipoprotein with Yx(FWY)xxD motif